MAKRRKKKHQQNADDPFYGMNLLPIHWTEETFDDEVRKLVVENGRKDWTLTTRIQYAKLRLRAEYVDVFNSVTKQNIHSLFSERSGKVKDGLELVVDTEHLSLDDLARKAGHKPIMDIKAVSNAEIAESARKLVMGAIRASSMIANYASNTLEQLFAMQYKIEVEAGGFQRLWSDPYMHSHKLQWMDNLSVITKLLPQFNGYVNNTVVRQLITSIDIKKALDKTGDDVETGALTVEFIQEFVMEDLGLGKIMDELHNNPKIVEAYLHTSLADRGLVEMNPKHITVEDIKKTHGYYKQKAEFEKNQSKESLGEIIGDYEVI